jgi:hypothetical protein
VTLLAFVWGAGEVLVAVAVTASHGCMGIAQRKTGAEVIEIVGNRRRRLRLTTANDSEQNGPTHNPTTKAQTAGQTKLKKRGAVSMCPLHVL